MTTADAIGRRIGKAIARDVIADGMPREWTGIEAQDADLLLDAGIAPDSAEWAAAEAAAEDQYLTEIEAAK